MDKLTLGIGLCLAAGLEKITDKQIKEEIIREVGK